MQFPGWIYSRLIYDTRLSHGAFRLWHILRDRTGKNECCWPSVRKLALDLDTSPSSVSDWTQELVKYGYLKFESGNRHEPNRYFLIVGARPSEHKDGSGCHAGHNATEEPIPELTSEPTSELK